MEMNKKFEKTEDGLKVTVNASDKIWLPMEDGSKDFIGRFEQVTTQYIEKDKAVVLRDFIAREHAKGVGQQDALNKQLEPLKGITDIDPEVVQAVKERIGKGTKEFKQKMLVLNDHIAAVQKKKQTQMQLEHISKEVERMTQELADINKVIE